MKKRSIAMLLLVCMAFAILAGCGSTPGSSKVDATAEPEASQAEVSVQNESSAATAAEQAPAEADLPEIAMNYSSCFPDTHGFSVLDKEWMDELAAKGNIKLTPFWNNALVSATAPYTETLAGVADITHIPAGAEADHFVIDNAVQAFYYGVTDQQALYETAKELYAQTPEWQKEYEGVRVCTWGVSGLMSLHSTKPIKSLDDIKGMTIRCTEDNAFELISRLGGNPIRMPVAELFEALSKGIVEGVVLPVEALKSTGVADLVKYSVPLNFSGAWCPHSYINEASYAKLTPDQQAIFDEVSAARSQAEVDAGPEWDAAGEAYALEKGVEFGTLSDEDYAKITTILEELAMDKIKALNDAGYDGQGIYDKARSILESKVG